MRKLENYRAVFGLPICGKVFECLICNNVFEIFNENELYSSNQSGFQPGNFLYRSFLSHSIIV